MVLGPLLAAGIPEDKRPDYCAPISKVCQGLREVGGRTPVTPPLIEQLLYHDYNDHL